MGFVKIPTTVDHATVRVKTPSETPSEFVHFVYIVRCADGTLYTGYARDPRRRENVHNLGRGARYTAGRRPVRLVYSEGYGSRGEALKREHELKRWSRAKKERLVARQTFHACPRARPQG